jgi:4-hydroxybenzoate polyprenyltransferase
MMALLYMLFIGEITLFHSFTYFVSTVAVITLVLAYYGKFGIKRLFIGLRTIPFVKNVVITLVWLWTISALPFLLIDYQDIAFEVWKSKLLETEVINGVFIFVASVLSDVKDMSNDQRKGIKTLVVSLGLKNSLFYFCMPSMFLCLLYMSIGFYHADLINAEFIVQIPSFLLAFISIFSLQKSKKDWYYLLFVDGFLLLKGAANLYHVFT